MNADEDINSSDTDEGVREVLRILLNSDANKRLEGIKPSNGITGLRLFNNGKINFDQDEEVFEFLLKNQIKKMKIKKKHFLSDDDDNGPGCKN